MPRTWSRRSRLERAVEVKVRDRERVRVCGVSPGQRVVQPGHGSVDIRRRLAVFVKSVSLSCGLARLTPRWAHGGQLRVIECPQPSVEQPRRAAPVHRRGPTWGKNGPAANGAGDYDTGV
jgi:hypothetical protein